MATQQIETATIVGTITQSGNAKITVTSSRISTNPTVISVAVLITNTATDVALACRTAIALNSIVSDAFQVSGAGANIILTERTANANDATLNIASGNDTCLGLTAEPTSANTQAGDGLTNCYITLAQLKAAHELGIAATDLTYDSALEDVINATSREVDNFCNQRFWKNAVDETRYFTPTQNDQCLVGNLVSATSIKTDTNLDRTYVTTWAATDYDLYPYNAALDTEPYWRVDKTPNGLNDFNAWANSTMMASPFTKDNTKYVQIVGIFGWPSIPQQVQQATLLWAMRAWMRHSTILGVSSSTALGQMKVEVPPPDPDVAQLLSNYALKITGVI